jgi:hypothetical protein
MKGKTIRRIILWTIAALLLLAGVLFTIGYFYYSRIVRNYLIETINRESKGLYNVTIRNLWVNVLAGDVTIDHFSLQPDTAWYHAHVQNDSLAPLVFAMRIDQFRIRGFHIMDAIQYHRIDVSRIRFIKPEITVYRMKMAPETKDPAKKQKMTSIPLPKGLESIGISEFIIDKATLEFVDCSRDSVTRNKFPECSIFIKHILVDSTHQGKRRLFNADDISVKIGEYSLATKNGMNRISFREISLSTASGEVRIKGFHLEPLFSRHDYTRKLGYQTDRMDITAASLSFHRVNLRDLLFEGRVEAGLLAIDSLNIDDYRDKRVVPRAGFKPPMPHDGIRNLKAYLRIDTVTLKNSRAAYAEQTGPAPGTIFFDKMGATFTGLTNDSVLLNAGLVSELKGTLYLMGKGKIDATVRFRFGDRRNTFTCTASVGPFDLKEINPMMSNLLPARVESGRINKLVVPMITANDDFATGKLLFYYNDLQIHVEDKKQTTWNKIKTGVINFAANDLIINNDNPTKNGKLKTGTIHFVRDKEKGIINFVWKSVLSGLKSTMGFNSKAQKDMIKEEKAEAEKKRKK